MRILLVGCDGQVGFLLSEIFRDQAELLPVNRSELDITNEHLVNEVISSFKPQVIINAAAYTAVDNAEHDEEKAFAVNGFGPKYLAKASNSVGAVLIHISTDYVFEGDKEKPYSESDPVNPQSVYGKSKLEGEVAIKEYCRKYIILRTSWVFARRGHNFVNTMLRLGKEKTVLSIVGDQYGGPTYAGDIANLVAVIVGKIENGENINWGLYHYSGLPHVSWYEFAEIIFTKAKEHNCLKTVPIIKSIETKDFLTPAKRPKNSRLDCAKIQAEFDVLPSDWQSEVNNLDDYTEVSN
jgi:dTDP-4-dehydrorhamnose reductase